jgi:hypothetical protein
LLAICAGAPAANTPTIKQMQRFLIFTAHPPQKFVFMFFSSYLLADYRAGPEEEVFE